MTTDAEKNASSRKRARGKRRFVCHLCKREVPYAWNCKCGFMICPECMEENKPLIELVPKLQDMGYELTPISEILEPRPVQRAITQASGAARIE